MILTLCSYPLQVHPCRAALDKVFSRHEAPTPVQGTDETYAEEEEEDALEYSGHTALLHGRGHRNSDHRGSREEMSLQKLCLLTGIILSLSFVIALLVDDLGLVLGYVGSVGSTTISFIVGVFCQSYTRLMMSSKLPGILFASLHKTGPRSRLRHVGGALAIVSGLVKKFQFNRQHHFSTAFLSWPSRSQPTFSKQSKEHHDTNKLTCLFPVFYASIKITINVRHCFDQKSNDFAS